MEYIFFESSRDSLAIKSSPPPCFRIIITVSDIRLVQSRKIPQGRENLLHIAPGESRQAALPWREILRGAISNPRHF